MRRALPAAAVALSLAAITARPAAAADKEQRQMMADIRMLQEQAQQLQNVLTNLTEALKAINARMDQRFDEQTNISRKAFADEKLVIDNIAHDLGVVREKADDNAVRVGSLTQELEALRQLVQQGSLPRPTVGAEPGDSFAPPAPPDSAPAPTGIAAVGASPEKLWAGAYADYTQAQYDLAILGFEAYIKSFPTSVKASEAQVNICNAYLQQGKYDKARDACDVAIRTYPTGTTIPEAYYRKGLALQSLKQLDLARQAYETAVQKYPESAAATLANQKLRELKKP
jgi:TolA-binding protein